jgi:hypothetical protein
MIKHPQNPKGMFGLVTLAFYFSKTCLGFFFNKILLKFYSTFSSFISGSLNHPNIISKKKSLGIHNFE